MGETTQQRRDKRREPAVEGVARARCSAGLYIHIPYCVRKCPYCDFNSYGTNHQETAFIKQAADYVDALILEFSRYCADNEGATIVTSPGLKIPSWNWFQFDTVFIGGGTPSLLPTAELVRLLEFLKRSGRIATDAEISLEANPGTIDEQLGLEKLIDLRSAGYNRISFGSQSFSPRKLQILGRIHKADDTFRAVEYARAAGFNNLNLDLMYGVKDENADELGEDLNQIFALNPEHISAYCLTIEPGTEFGSLKRRGIDMTSGEDFQSDAYLETRSQLEDRGYSQYEVSNFATPGKACQHNRGYWSGKAYLGLGAGAASYLPCNEPWHAATQDNVVAVRWVNLPGPMHYIQQTKGQGSARQNIEELSLDRAIREFFFLRLRRSEGVTEDEFRLQFGKQFPPRLKEVMNSLQVQGLMTSFNNRVSLTARGFLFSNSVFDEIAETLLASANGDQPSGANRA